MNKDQQNSVSLKDWLSKSGLDRYLEKWHEQDITLQLLVDTVKLLTENNDSNQFKLQMKQIRSDLDMPKSDSKLLFKAILEIIIHNKHIVDETPHIDELPSEPNFINDEIKEILEVHVIPDSQISTDIIDLKVDTTVDLSKEVDKIHEHHDHHHHHHHKHHSQVLLEFNSDVSDTESVHNSDAHDLDVPEESLTIDIPKHKLVEKVEDPLWITILKSRLLELSDLISPKKKSKPTEKSNFIKPKVEIWKKLESYIPPKGKNESYKEYYESVRSNGPLFSLTKHSETPKILNPIDNIEQKMPLLNSYQMMQLYSKPEYQRRGPGRPKGVKNAKSYAKYYHEGFNSYYTPMQANANLNSMWSILNLDNSKTSDCNTKSTLDYVSELTNRIPDTHEGGNKQKMIDYSAQVQFAMPSPVKVGVLTPNIQNVQRQPPVYPQFINPRKKDSIENLQILKDLGLVWKRGRQPKPYPF